MAKMRQFTNILTIATFSTIVLFFSVVIQWSSCCVQPITFFSFQYSSRDRYSKTFYDRNLQ